MLNSWQNLLHEVKKQHKNRRKWMALFLAMAVVVGAGTVYLLIQPGTAMEGKLICGLEEHTHMDDCYSKHLVCENTEPDHVHTKECYAFDYELTCGLEEGPEHTHSDACWEKVLTCTRQEHIHNQNCYRKPEKPDESPASGAGHEAGVNPESEEPSQSSKPTQSEESSQSSEPTQSEEPSQSSEPTQSEEPSQSSEPTQSEEPSQSSEPTQSEEPSQSSEPTQGEESSQNGETSQTEDASQKEEPDQTTEETKPVLEGKLICEKQEHTHTDACYEKKLICGQEEGENHTHTEACWEKTLICTLEEHTHGKECYETTGEKPSLEGLPQNRIPEEYTDRRMAQGPSGLTVTVFARPDVLAADVQPRVSLVQPESGEYRMALDRLAAAGIPYDYVSAVDISLRDGQGTPVEPEEPVYIQMDVGNLLPGEANLGTLEIQHHGAVSEETVDPDDRSLLSSAVTVETVVGDNRGGLELDETSKAVATFPTEGFSVYTLTASEQPSEIPTVSTKQYGIQIDLFDYHEDWINRGGKLYFGQGGAKGTYNAWTGNGGGVYTGIVQNSLSQDGYPVMSDSGQSLGYLFGQGHWGTVKSLTNLDHLFQRDSDGYFHYNSSLNFAEAPTSSGGNFRVYNSPAPGDTHDPKFMPFNTYDEISFPVSPPVYPDQDGNRNYLFGMHLRIPFLMPPGGMLEGQDMIFEFAGDDDVWVFVDGKLALDLGGIHDSYQGCINFRTGAVTTNSQGAYDQYDGNCPNLYGEKGEQGRPEAYTRHTIEFFYLERGKGGSNCQLKFNLIAMNHGLVVGKRLPERIRSLSPTEQIRFHYKVETQGPDDTQRKPLANAMGTVYRWDHNNPGHASYTGKLTTDQDGTFYLRPDERIHFADQIQLDQAGAGEEYAVKIFVSEILPSGIVMKNVSASVGAEYLPDTCVQHQGQNVIPPLYETKGENYHPNNSPLEVQKNEKGETLYTAALFSDRTNKFNWIDFENDPGELCKLEVTKEAFRKDVVTPVEDETFPIRIQVFDIYEKKWQSLPVGTRFQVTKAGEQPNPDPFKWTGRSDDSGLIWIHHNETIHMRLFPGTRYRVTEPLEMANYNQSFSGTENGNPLEPESWTDPETSGVYYGIGNEDRPVKPGSIEKITVRNTEKSPVLEIQKKVQGEPPQETQDPFKIKVAIKKNGSYQPLNPGSLYWLVRGNAAPVENTVPGDGLIPMLAEDKIYLVLPIGTDYRVSEVLTPAEQEFCTPSYSGTVKQGTQIQNLSQTTWDGKITGMESANAACDSFHRVVITNTFVKPGSLTVEKKVLFNGEKDPDNQTAFPFIFTLNNEKQVMESPKITLKTQVSSDGKIWTPGENLVFTRQENGKYRSKELKIQNGQTLQILGIPAFQTVTVGEVPTPGYAISWEGREIPEAAAKQTPSITTNPIEDGGQLEVICVNTTGTELPETGGMGVLPIVLLGALLLAAALLLMFKMRIYGA